jgi:hypothetical protein
LTIFYKQETLRINPDKNGLGYILGNLFRNSSGHPASDLLKLDQEEMMLHMPKKVSEILNIVSTKFRTDL